MLSERNSFAAIDKRIKKKKKPSPALSSDCLALGGLLLMYPVAAHGDNIAITDEKRIEVSTEKKIEAVDPKPEDYDLEKICTLDLKFLKEKKSCDREASAKIISSIILYDYGLVGSYYNALHNYEKAHPELKKLSLNEKRLASSEFNYLYEGWKVELDKFFDLYENIMIGSVEEAKERLKIANIPDSIMNNVDNAHEVFKIIESERAKVLNSISSENYLKKLQIEFNCSVEVAKAHQQTRFKNVDNVNYLFTSSKSLGDIYNAQGLYYPNSNNILIPYDVDLKGNDRNKISASSYAKTVAHEFWHAATNSNSGLSLSAKALLKITKDQLNASDSSYNIEYFGNPTERYARFKSLESELTEMKIWSKGQVFSKECSDKMLNAYNNKEFKNLDSYQFIDAIVASNNKSGYTNLLDFDQLYNIFSEIFNSLASLETNKTYYPQQWWGSKEEKA